MTNKVGPDLSTPEKRQQYWSKAAAESLVNKKIVAAGYARDEVFGYVLSITLSDGTSVFVMSDDEGNGPGALHLEAHGDAKVKHSILPQLY